MLCSAIVGHHAQPQTQALTLFQSCCHSGTAGHWSAVCWWGVIAFSSHVVFTFVFFYSSPHIKLCLSVSAHQFSCFCPSNSLLHPAVGNEQLGGSELSMAVNTPQQGTSHYAKCWKFLDSPSSYMKRQIHCEKMVALRSGWFFFSVDVLV